MNKSLQFALAYFSLALNLSYLFLWIYAFTKYNLHEGRTSFFEQYIPFSSPAFEILLIALSVFSIIVFARSSSGFGKVLSLIQIAVAALLVWQVL